MSSIFRAQQLLYCQTIEQCLRLDADVHKGWEGWRGKPQTRGRKTGILGMSFKDDPQASLHYTPNIYCQDSCCLGKPSATAAAVWPMLYLEVLPKLVLGMINLGKI